MAVRPGLAEARDPHQHDLRVDARKLVIAEPPALEGSGTVVLDDDVGVLDRGCLKSSCPSFVERLRVIKRLLRAITFHQSDLPAFMGAQWRIESPSPGCSILITSAPKSAMWVAARGPAIIVPASMTLRPSGGHPTHELRIASSMAPFRHRLEAAERGGDREWTASSRQRLSRAGSCSPFRGACRR